jgi:hypothetical protein
MKRCRGGYLGSFFNGIATAPQNFKIQYYLSACCQKAVRKRLLDQCPGKGKQAGKPQQHHPDEYPGPPAGRLAIILPDMPEVRALFKPQVRVLKKDCPLNRLGVVCLEGFISDKWDFKK